MTVWSLVRRVAGLVAFVAGLACGAPARAADSACPPTARTPTAEQVRAAQAQARDRGFLWRISKDGRSSYLYGTVHVARQEWMYPGATVLRAVQASELVALELDLLDPEIAQRLNSALVAQDGAALPEALAARLRAQAQRACVPLAALGAMPPEMQALTLSVLSARVDGLDPAYAIDPFLSGLARSLAKPVVSLETPESQAELLRSDSARERIDTVDKTLRELESGRSRAMVRRVAQVWADSRFDELQRYAQWCDCARTVDERRALHRLLDQRNPLLVERIAAMHEDGHTVFAAVGSLHMIGASGLPALLAQRGFRVERVPLG